MNAITKPPRAATPISIASAMARLPIDHHEKMIRGLTAEPVAITQRIHRAQRLLDMRLADFRVAMCLSQRNTGSVTVMPAFSEALAEHITPVKNAWAKLRAGNPAYVEWATIAACPCERVEIAHGAISS